MTVHSNPNQRSASQVKINFGGNQGQFQQGQPLQGPWNQNQEKFQGQGQARPYASFQQ